jgi:hypothetical protein
MRDGSPLHAVVTLYQRLPPPERYSKAGRNRWAKAVHFEPNNLRAIYIHFTNPAGVCRNCQTPLSTNGLSECSNCHSINIDW